MKTRELASSVPSAQGRPSGALRAVVWCKRGDPGSLLSPLSHRIRGILREVSNYFRGLRLAFSGLKTGFGSKSLRRSYLRYVGAVLLLALALEWVAWSYLGELIPQWEQAVGAWSQSDTGQAADPSWWQKLVGSYFKAQDATLKGVVWTLGVVLRISSALIAPYVAFALINAVMPMFNEAIFMGSLKGVDIPLFDELDYKDGRPLYKSFCYSMFRLARFLLGAAGIALLGFIPLVGSVLTTALSAIWTAHNLSWELLEPYFDRRNESWARQKVVLAENRWMRLGFATPVALLLAIPIVGVFFFAMAQASAAALASKIEGNALALDDAL